MSFVTILEKADKIKLFMSNKYEKLKKNKDDITNFLLDTITMLFLLLILLFLIFFKFENQIIFVSIIITILAYSVINKCIESVNIYLRYLREKTQLEQLDLDLTGSIGKNEILENYSSNKSISQALDDHIEDILNSNILFFMNIPNDEYIRNNTEQEILQSLIDNVTKFTSDIFKKKLGLYYGDQNVDILIGRRCLIIVSLYVANHNKNIYVSTSKPK